MQLFFKYIIFIFSFFVMHVVLAQSGKELNEEAKKYIESDPQKAYELLVEAQKQKNNSPKLQENIDLNISIVKRIKGEFKEVVQLSETLLKTASDENTKASIYNNLGATYKRMGEHEKAMQNYLLAHKIYASKQDLRDAATVENNIGLLYQALENFPKAKEYHQVALEHFQKLKDNAGIARSYNMLGIVAANEGDLGKGLSLFQKSYELELLLANKVGISEALSNIGSIYFYMENLDSSLVYFKKSLDMDRQNNDYSNLADGFNNLADIYMNATDFHHAKIYLDSAMHLASKHKYAHAYLRSLENYGYLYEMQEDLEQTNKYLRRYYTAKDSVAKLSNLKNLQELETKYQTEKKEKQLLAKEIEIKQKTNLITLFSTLLIAFIVIGFLIYRALKLKNKQQKQEFKLKEAIATIETQTKLQEQRLAISRDLHDNIGAQLTFIISSVETLKYAFKITDEKINAKLYSIVHFTKDTITELRDTIWAMNHDAIHLSEIQERISNFVNKAKTATNDVTFQFQTETHLADIQFSSVVGMNIYRIIQEAVNNALKYAEASQISIAVQTDSNELIIHVQDNGLGFDTTGEATGNGLRNMEKRAAEIQAQYLLTSELGVGTKMELKVSTQV